MTSRSITIAGFIVIACAIAALDLAARLTSTSRLSTSCYRWIRTFSKTLDVVLDYRVGRVVVLMIWIWIGWHFLARSG